MTAKKSFKLTKGRIAAIISAAVVALLFLSLIIINIFIPVKYLTAWLVSAEERESGVLTVTFLDVGYGDSTLCELPDGKVLLIDGGDGAYTHTLALLKKLNSRGIDKIDYLVCSSVLGEYCGGLAEILKYKQVGKVFMPQVNNTGITQAYASFVSALGEEQTETEISQYGVGFAGEDYFFTFLSPSSPDNPLGFYSALQTTASHSNMLNISAIMWLEYAGTSFAFTSSAGSDALNAVVDDYQTIIQTGGRYAPMGDFCVQLENCDIVSVPGHGDDDCTSAQWYDALKPSVAVISVGENYSGYPSAQALADIGSAVASPMLTSTRGDITITVTAQGYTIN